MDKVIIREAIIEDYQCIYELNKQSLGYDYDINKTKQRLKLILEDKHNKVLVALISDKVVGYVHGASYECSYADSFKNILALAINPNYQKRGIGKKLMLNIEAWAKNDGAVGVRLVSGEERIKAHKFYESCGYTNRKGQKNFIKLWENN